jgi:hypothetical protein
MVAVPLAQDAGDGKKGCIVQREPMLRLRIFRAREFEEGACRNKAAFAVTKASSLRTEVEDGAAAFAVDIY